MLCEIKNIKQYKNEPRRRWFYDDFFDLVIWSGDDNEIVGFQLCYDKTKEHRALTWHQGSGFLHNKVDDGEGDSRGAYKPIPILLIDGIFQNEKIAKIFKKESQNLEASIADFIYEKLKNYSA
ncbi:MAG: hypothetical protein HQK76_17310 [Desulfobacterales bacterium]|nr:hypothetical protein [Desulfobacterales bacterium]